MLVPTWSIQPFDRYETGLTWSFAVDDNENIYISTGHALWKLDSKQDSNQKPENLLPWNDEDYAFAGVLWKNDKLYVCGYTKNVLYEFDLKTNTLSTLAGNEEAGWKDGTFKEAQFHYPWAILIDENEDLIITDQNHARKLNMKQGIVETIAGCKREDAGYEDGPNTSAKFDDPTGITISVDGTIYITDRSNNRVRKIKDGIVSTVGEDFECLFNKSQVYETDSDAEMYKDGSFFEPYGLMWNRDNTFFVWEDKTTKMVDLNNQTISIVKELHKMDIQSVLRDKKGNLFVLVAEGVIKFEGSWKWEKFLWIGHQKEQWSDCHLARLPKELIREIAAYLCKTEKEDVKK